MISVYGDYLIRIKSSNDLMIKSFHFEELLMRIQLLVRRNNALEKIVDEIFSIEDLTINKTDQKVFSGGQQIALTVKEFQLLVFLAEASGRTVSKQQITEYVWEQNFNTNTNTVETYINFSRKKIDKNFTVKLIHTRFGYGDYLNAI